jgi:amidophosphoribosyltransferase
MNGMYRAVGEKGRNSNLPQFCDACFSGDYPIELTDLHGGRKGRQLSLLAEVA